MPMSATQIRAALKRKRLTYDEVGALAEPKLSKTIISRNIKKVPSHKSARARCAIAKALELPVEEVFGEVA